MGTDIWDGDPGELLPVTRGELRRLLGAAYACGERWSMGWLTDVGADVATCRVVSRSEHGPHMEDTVISLSCGHNASGYVPAYCPHCGRKVVEDGE